MFIAFGIIALLIYGALVFYVGWSGYKGFGIKGNRLFLILYSILFTFISTSFLLARFSDGSTIMQVIGGYWLAIFCLLLMILPLVHLIMLLLRFTNLDKTKIRVYATFSSICILIGLLMYGTYLAYTPKIVDYNVQIDGVEDESLKIVMVSDTHFGYLSGIKHAKRLVKEINQLNADIVLFPGDIIDDDLGIVEKKGIFPIISEIKSKYGMYGSLGNHDKYRGQMEELISSIEQSNIKILYDESILIDDRFYIVGRRDKTESDRMPTSDLVANLDHNKALIMLDHQPYEFDLAEKAGIDLLLSGHTHKGQIAPGNLITKRLFENDWGYLKKETLHSIVSSGYGFWGPPIRLGSQAEIVVINVTFQK